uniref:Putative conserved secreted protein n=1 Tax=Rhipicephalus microplus TaxID=6941 RepID=A0A6G5A6U8_RHIMP
MVGQKLSVLLILALVAVVIAKPRKKELNLEARSGHVACVSSSESEENEVGNTGGPPALPRLPTSGGGTGLEKIPTDASD